MFFIFLLRNRNSYCISLFRIILLSFSFSVLKIRQLRSNFPYSNSSLPKQLSVRDQSNFQYGTKATFSTGPKQLSVRDQSNFQYGTKATFSTGPKQLSVRDQSNFQYGTKATFSTGPKQLSVRDQSNFQYGTKVLFLYFQFFVIFFKTDLKRLAQ